MWRSPSATGDPGQPPNGRPEAETTPGAPEGPSSTSTPTGPDAVTTSGRRPPTTDAPSTTRPDGDTITLATGRPPARGVTVTSTGDEPGSAIASERMAPPATSGLPADPGPTTSQDVAVAVVPPMSPPWGDIADGGATTLLPTTTGDEAATVTEYGDPSG